MSDNEQQPEGEEGGIKARDLTAQLPGDEPTAWQRAMAERKAERETEGEELPEAKKAELLRCAEAFEHTAAKLREIVGE